MSTAAYRYLSDDGTIYQVQLPTDLASQLGYVAATGLEPYLPSYLQMRYATFQSVPSSLVLAAPVTNPFRPGIPPSSFSVGAQIYFQKSLYGETRNANVNQMAQTISGPQGQTGPTGAIGPIGPQGPPGIATLVNATTFTSWTNGTTVSIGTFPSIFGVFWTAQFNCLVAQGGYAVGDSVVQALTGNFGNSVGMGIYNPTGTSNYSYTIGSGGLFLPARPGGGSFSPTSGNWQIKLFTF